MSDGNLVIGGVYSTGIDKRPHRVLAYDRFELFYDGWWEHKNDWGLRSHNGKVFFFRSKTSDFEKSAQLIRVDTLTEEEQTKYKLSLPFRLCRHDQISWGWKPVLDMAEFADYLAVNNIEISESPVLQADKIVLVPFGPNGGHKKSSVIQADNGKFFSELELLWKAHNIQMPFQTHINNGVGLYRLGLEKRLASYYIGGYYDLAEFTKE